MPAFESSVSEKLMVVGDSQTENTEINNMFNIYTYSFPNRGVCVGGMCVCKCALFFRQKDNQNLSRHVVT